MECNARDVSDDLQRGVEVVLVDVVLCAVVSRQFAMRLEPTRDQPECESESQNAADRPTPARNVNQQSRRHAPRFQEPTSRERARHRADRQAEQQQRGAVKNQVNPTDHATRFARSRVQTVARDERFRRGGFVCR